MPDNTFFINAFGNPDDGYGFQGSTVPTNISHFQSINVVNHYLENQFCLKAIVSPNSTILTVESTFCYLKTRTICRKGPNSRAKLSACNKTSLLSDNILNILSDPLSTFQIEQAGI